MFENLIEALNGTPYYVAAGQGAGIYVLLCTSTEGMVSEMFSAPTLDQAALKLARSLASEGSGILLTPNVRQHIAALVEGWTA